MKMRREQTIIEEKVNYITHAAGILFSIIAIPFLISYAAERSNAATVWGVCIFSFAMLMVYFASTIYHAVKQNTNTKRKLRVWDHISIFVMIGGSYTPVVIKFTDSKTSLVFLSTMWGIILLGSLLKVFFTGKYILLEVILYLALGWMAVFIIKPLIANMPSEIFLFILVSGLFYSVGVIFYLWKNLTYHHAVWHVFVLAGSVTHFFAVYNSIPVMIRFD
jgi:hemolysin III